MPRVRPAFSVVIPTRDRPGYLSRCLECLAQQDLAHGCRSEVLVAIDGEDPASEVAARAIAGRLDVKLVRCERRGIAHAKNRAIDAAEGELLVLLNDDVLPARDFLNQHWQAHHERGGEPMMVVGHSPWVVQPRDTLFARVLRETSMVFFYDRMIDSGGKLFRPADHDWGYRHAWNLNLSCRLEHARGIGGFDPRIANCCYEDVEFAFRFTRELGEGHPAPVLFRPGATAPHDHPYTPAGYLKREFRLGYSAFAFAMAAPACARDLFGADLTHPAEAAYARAFVEHESRHQAMLLEEFARTDELPSQTPAPFDVVRLVFQQHLLLKRLHFRRGLLSAVDGRREPGLFHIDDLKVFAARTPSSQPEPERIGV